MAIKKPVFERAHGLRALYVKEYSQNEISGVLDVPLTTVAKRLYSAKVRLRTMMLDEFKMIYRSRPSRNTSFAEKVKAGMLS